MRNKTYILIGTLLTVVCLAVIIKTAVIPVFSKSDLYPDYQLLVKSKLGDVNAVRNMLRDGADPNTLPNSLDKGMTALMFATWKKHEEITKLLVRAGANVNASAANGSTPLTYAASQGDANSVRFLLNNGANPNFQRPDGKTAIMFAVANEHTEIVKILARVTNRDLLNSLRYVHGDSLINGAVKSGNQEMVAALLEANLGLENRDRFGQTPLMNAARAGKTLIVIRLLNKGASINAADANGKTALVKAIVANRRAVIQVLRARGGRTH